MHTTDPILSALFALLALLALPSVRLRQALLFLLQRGGHLATLAGVAACGLFALRPSLTPGALCELSLTIAPANHPGLAWLVMAAVLVALALPLLAHLEYARELAAQAAHLRALRQGFAAPTNATAVPTLSRTPAAKGASAGEGLRAPAGTAPGKLIKDLLPNPR